MSAANEATVRVLLIDDDRDDYILTRDYLADIPGGNYALDWVSQYDEGLERICEGKHDVYLLDYRLGDRNGIDLLIESRQRTCSGPVILLTGQSMWELDLAAMKVGAADFLEKSRLDPTLLERSIRYALQQRRYEAELERQVDARTKELAEANEALKEGDRRKDRFLATLAHELRNPLAPIRNALQIMRLPAVTPDSLSKAREIIDRQVRHMIRLIDDLLDVSRITRGKLTLQIDELDLRDAIESAIETSQPLLEVSRITLERTVPGEPILMRGDRLRLAQVFANILNNSAKYAEGGSVSLTAMRQGKEAIIHIRDNGQGIPPELLPGIFDLFTQTDRALNRSKGGGLGIGLGLAQQIVQLHGGHMTAQSEGLGKGAEFTVHLPV